MLLLESLLVYDRTRREAGRAQGQRRLPRSGRARFVVSFGGAKDPDEFLRERGKTPSLNVSRPPYPTSVYK
jgi:hypothetical protein